MSLTVGSLFSGIGGIDLGLERAGMTVRWQVEYDPYCQKVLKKHWPDVTLYGDIKTIDWMEVEHVDLIAGGFPCQPVSYAGKRLAQADERWLWPHFFRAVRVLRPRFVLVENVPGLLSAGLGDVLGDLASIGYDAEWERIPAASVGAHHLRHRIWIVAYPDCNREGVYPGAIRPPKCALRWGEASHVSSGCGEILADAENPRQQTRFVRQGKAQPWGSDSGGERWWEAEPDVGRVAYGVPARVDRLRGLGNAVVPQVVEWIGRQIVAVAG